MAKFGFGFFAVAIVLVVTFFAGIFAHQKGLAGEYQVKFTRWTSPSFLFSFNAPELPEITIDMKLTELRKVEAKREEALQRGHLFASDDDFVPAQMQFEGRTIPVKMRLKGDNLNHLESDKWSYRVHVKGDDAILGIRRFSIQHPSTRRYLYEWLFLETLRMEDVLAPRYHFINVVFNGDHKGIYALEEFFSKEMIEANRRREGVLLSFDEDLLWDRKDQFDFSDTGIVPEYYQNVAFDVYGSGRVASSPTLSLQRDQALSLLRGFQQGTLRPSEVFDVDILARYLAVSELYSAAHGLFEINSIFYFNPLTGRIEPVGFDGAAFATSIGSDGGRLHALNVGWTRKALSDPEVAGAYVSELERIASDDFLNSVKEALDGAYKRNTKALRPEWPNLKARWDEVENRQKILSALLDAPRLVQALQISNERVPGESPSSTTVQVANLFALPTEVLGIKVGDGPLIPASDARVSPGPTGTSEHAIILGPKEPDQPLEFVDFLVPLPAGTESSGDGAPSILVVNRLLGASRVRETPVTPYVMTAHDTAIPAAPTADEALARHPYLEMTGDSSMLRIPQGVWYIEKDLVLPDKVGLYLDPGTTLLFAPDAILLARGPLVFQGSPEEPVVLGPSGASWAGVVVLESKKPSLWMNVSVVDTHGVGRGGWVLTGGITFYESSIILDRSRIVGSSAEDAINVVRTTFRFNESEIANTASDGFDGDFTDGLIANTIFHDIGGDAIDVSGSTIRIEDVLVRNVGDKGISVGEASYADVTRFEADRVGVGIASKDRSFVTVSDSTLRSFVYAGLAAYMKKREFGPASIVADNVTLQGENAMLIQKGSWIERDGERFEGIDLDVAALNEAGILGN